MKYVSEICRTSIDGQVSYPNSINEVYNTELKAVISDTDSGYKESFRATELFDIDCLGFDSVRGAESCAMVCLTDKTAKLHRYITDATTTGDRSEILNNADCCTLNGVNTVTMKNPGSTALDIHTVDDTILVGGKLGSVAMRQTGYIGKVVIMSMYDLLGSLCRELGLNVMKYETIQLYNGRTCYTTVIRLLHSQESERFFTKMYLDVTKA